jgi:hypothetical protein
VLEQRLEVAQFARGRVWRRQEQHLANEFGRILEECFEDRIHLCVFFRELGDFDLRLLMVTKHRDRAAVFERRE